MQKKICFILKTSTAFLIIDILLSLWSFGVGLAVDLFVGCQHLVKVLVDLSIFPGHYPPEDCLRDGTCLLCIKHFKTLQQLLGRIGRSFIFSVESEEFIEWNTLVGLVNWYFFSCPHRAVFVVSQKNIFKKLFLINWITYKAFLELEELLQIPEGKVHHLDL